MSISNESPPHIVDKELRSWLQQRVIETNISLLQAKDYDPIYIMPSKVKIGMVRYFGSAITGIASEGLWCYKSTGWTKIV